MVIVEHQSAQQSLPSIMSGQLHYVEQEELQRPNMEQMVLLQHR
jgi:hypothetical protein